MGLLDFLFGKSKQAAPAPSPAAASQSVPARAMPHADTASSRFDPNLISTLMREHRSLLALFGEIAKARQAQDFAAVKGALQTFQMTLNLHLAVENVHFYTYLRRNLKSDTRDHQTMTAFFDEMQGIGKAVTLFLRKYIDCDFTPELRTSFAHELEGIGAALVSRIEREEENLYKLYTPNPGAR